MSPYRKSQFKAIVLGLVTVGLGFLSLVSTPAGATSPTITTFDVSGSTDTEVGRINNLGQVAGDYLDSTSRGYVRDAQGNITTYDPPGAVITQSFAINDLGRVVGYYWDSTSSSAHGFVRDAQGNVTTFDVSGAIIVVPSAINNLGQVAGYSVGGFTTHGFVRDAHGNITTLDVSGATSTFPYAINDLGQVAGFYLDSSSHYHGFVRDAQGNITTFDVSGATHTFPQAINDFGQVAGYYYDGNNHLHGFIATFVLSSPSQLLASLIATVTTLGFHQGENLLQNALRQVNAGQTTQACNQLGAFINKVEAQAGEQLIAAEASGLAAAATQIQAALGCD